MTSSHSEDASGMQTHENESQLKHVLVDDTHLKMEDFHAFRADPTKKTDGGKSVLELQNWCKEVLQDGKTDKDLVKDFMRKSQWNEEGIAFLHLIKVRKVETRALATFYMGTRWTFVEGNCITTSIRHMSDIPSSILGSFFYNTPL